MSRPMKNPLTPNSLAADGMQGVGAEGLGPCGSEDNAEAALARILAHFSVRSAQAHLDRCATLLDRPGPGLVEAADSLELAAEWLAVAEFSYAVKALAGGEP